MSSPLLAALSGRCPACTKGPLYEGFLSLHELCPACGVRYERYVSTRTVATVLSFGVGAILAFGADFLIRGLGGEAWMLVPLTVGLGAVLYPIFRRFSVFLLWQNGLVTVDVPEEPRHPTRPAEPFGAPVHPILALPIEDDPTWADDRPPEHDDPTDDGTR